MGNMAEKSMPNFLSIRSMLSGEPVGEWHLTIGNPLNPIAVIGNLILEESTMEWGDTLGADDFPTEVKFTLKLKPGKPRDKGDIESIFNNGYGRMSYAPLTAMPSSQNTFGGKNKNNPDNKETTASANADSLYADMTTGKYKNDTALKLIKDRVTAQWGETFGNSANLLFMINATKSRF